MDKTFLVTTLTAASSQSIIAYNTKAKHYLHAADYMLEWFDKDANHECKHVYLYSTEDAIISGCYVFDGKSVYKFIDDDSFLINGSDPENTFRVIASTDKSIVQTDVSESNGSTAVYLIDTRWLQLIFVPFNGEIESVSLFTEEDGGLMIFEDNTVHVTSHKEKPTYRYEIVKYTKKTKHSSSTTEVINSNYNPSEAVDFAKWMYTHCRQSKSEKGIFSCDLNNGSVRYTIDELFTYWLEISK